MTPFEAAMLPRLRASASKEASRVVLDLVAGGRKLPDAVVDAVESLPWNETTDLRRWTDNWEAEYAWLRCEAHGWKLAKATPRRVVVAVPESKWATMHEVMRKPIGGMVYAPFHRGARGGVVASYDMRQFQLADVGGPSVQAVAAAADVGAVVVKTADADYTSTKNWKIIFNVTKQK